MILLALAVTLLAPLGAQAAPPLKVVLEDSLWGAAIGGLARAATVPFMNHPSRHYDRIAKGAGIGLLGGMIFGFCEISPVLYTYELPGHDRVYCLSLTVPLH